MNQFERILSMIDRINDWTGQIVAYGIFYMTFTVTYEVVARYLFNSPTIWSTEINQYVLLVTVALGGGYCLLHRSHITVDILWSKFSLRARAIIDIITSSFMFAFLFFFIWETGVMAWGSLRGGEVSLSVLEVPMFFVKVFLPLGGVLIFLQAIRILISNIRVLTSGIKDSEDMSRVPGGKGG